MRINYKHRNRVFLAALLVLMIALVAAFVSNFFSKQVVDHDPATNGHISLPEVKYFSIVNSEVEKNVSEERLVAVVIENHPDSRPQSGVGEAEVVYEMVAEGGITRFLALFQKSAREVGPVRSARPYFAELADSHEAVFAHVGGSPEVLENIKLGKYAGLLDLNEFWFADFFTRVKWRTAPHNTYSQVEKLRSFSKKDSLKPEKINLDFQSECKTPSLAANNVSIDFSKPSFFVDYSYNASSRSYDRFVSKQRDIDKDSGSQRSPKTLIVLETSITPVTGDTVGRVNIKTTSQGKAWFFSCGGVQEGEWKREAGQQYQYSLEDGSVPQVLSGQVWVHAVEHGKASWGE